MPAPHRSATSGALRAVFLVSGLLVLGILACPEEDPPPTDCLPDGGVLAGAYTLECFVVEEGVTATAVDDVVIVVTGEWPVRIDGALVGETKPDGDGASINIQAVSPIVVTGVIEAGHGLSPGTPGGDGGTLALQSSLDVDLTEADLVGAGHGGNGTPGAAGGKGGDLVLQYTQVYLDDREDLIQIGNGGHGGDEALTFEQLAVYATGGAVHYTSNARGGNGGVVVFGGPVFWPDTVVGAQAVVEAQERTTSGGAGGNAGSIVVSMGASRSSPPRWFRWLSPGRGDTPDFDDLANVVVTGADGGFGIWGGDGASVEFQKPDTPSTGRGIAVEARGGDGGYGFGGSEADGYWRAPIAGHGGSAVAYAGDAAHDANHLGGRARAYAGNGGLAQGYLQFDEFGQMYWVRGTSGDGGSAEAYAGNGSPTRPGGLARADGGDGGAAALAPTEDTFDTAGSGGAATAVSGSGGDGEGDCSLGGAGEHGGDGGEAKAYGGDAGAHSPGALFTDCMEAQEYMAWGGDATATGGDGGDGGDGDPPGSPGDAGATTATAGSQEGPCQPPNAVLIDGSGGQWGTDCNPGDDDTGDDDDDDDTGDDDDDDDTGDDDVGDDDVGDDDVGDDDVGDDDVGDDDVGDDDVGDDDVGDDDVGDDDVGDDDVGDDDVGDDDIGDDDVGDDDVGDDDVGDDDIGDDDVGDDDVGDDDVGDDDVGDDDVGDDDVGDDDVGDDDSK